MNSDGFIFCENRDNWLRSSDEALFRDCRCDFFKATGKGGQKRNKTSSAVRLHHLLSGLTAEESGSRSQHENRRHALRKLRLTIAMRVRRSESVIPERVEVSLDNAAYPLWVASVMDILYRHGFEPAPAAGQLGISPSKLVKLLGRDPHFWQELNRLRELHDLNKLKIPL